MKIERSKNIKEPKTFSEQVQILKSRNLVIDNDEETIKILKKVNYYRLSVYMLTYKTKEGIYDANRKATSGRTPQERNMDACCRGG